MQLSDIVNSQAVLSKVVSFDLPFNVSYKLTKNIKEIEEVLKLYDEKRKDLFEELGEKSGDDGIKIPKDKEVLFTDKLSKILEQKIDLDTPKISPKDLKDVKISVQDLLLIDWLISE